MYLCKLYGLTEKDVLCHCEGHDRGIASNHGDVMHWFPKHGKTMDDFRAAVKAGLEEKEEPQLDNTPSSWSQEAVKWATNNDLLEGTDTGDLKLRSPITREEFCVVLKRYHDKTQAGDLK